jgi:magnesium transporter
MNFKHIPELDWQFGYVYSILLMVVSIAIPFWIFHKKGWLR